ncbi:MAG: hypothetical protein ACW976_01620 [Candidatus Ranarchaeia archaeon]|jgi:hypothetical protein
MASSIDNPLKKELPNVDSQSKAPERSPNLKLQEKIVGFLKNPGFLLALVFFGYALFTRWMGLYYVHEVMGFFDRWFDLSTFETFTDYQHFYLVWIDAFWNSNWYPYTRAAEVAVLNIYAYTPVFLYIIAPFWWLPGQPLWIPILVGDAAAVIPVVMAGYELRGKYGGIFAGSVYTVSVLNIFYEGGIWMNPGISTFFLMMGVYLWGVKQQYTVGNLFFVLAVMTKQLLVLFVFPFYFILLTKDLKLGVKHLIGAGIGCVLLAMPYIVLTPWDFFNHLVGLSTNFDPTITNLGINHPLKLTQTLAYWLETQLGGNRVSLALFAVLYNSSMLFFIGAMITTFWALIHGAREYSREGMIVGVTIWVLILQLLFARGIYKYYFTAVFPLLAIAFSLVISDQQKWRSLIIGGIAGVGIVSVGWFMLVMERIVYEWVPLYLFLVLLTVAIINVGRKWRRSLKQKTVPPEV